MTGEYSLRRARERVIESFAGFRQTIMHGDGAAAREMTDRKIAEMHEVATGVVGDLEKCEHIEGYVRARLVETASASEREGMAIIQQQFDDMRALAHYGTADISNAVAARFQNKNTLMGEEE